MHDGRLISVVVIPHVLLTTAYITTTTSTSHRLSLTRIVVQIISSQALLYYMLTD
jgi:hypothetical protein